MEFRDGQTRGRSFVIHAFNTYSWSVDYMPATMPAAAGPSGNEPHAFPNFLGSPPTER